MRLNGGVECEGEGRSLGVRVLGLNMRVKGGV